MVAEMQAWVVERPGPVDGGPLRRVERTVPDPGPHQVRVQVRVCGVCRTDLHLAEGDVPPRRPGVAPGHEVVGLVDALGPGSDRWHIGDRVGVPWLAHTCGVCRFCVSGRENLCVAPQFTGWDIDGGYADFALVDEAYAYALPDRFDDIEAAPLLCAGIIGYRALRRAEVPEGGTLGIYGFGGSAHLTAQVALARGLRVHVMTRSAEARALALELGVASVNEADAAPPEPLDAAILFAPVGTLVPPALAALDRGGTLAIAGIYLSDVPVLNYQRHLFEERTLRSVTANTRRDGEDFLEEAARIGIRVSATPYPMADADAALRDLRHDRVNGAAVLVN
jgi:alcohol dehydrogenase, propanol-preferring